MKEIKQVQYELCNLLCADYAEGTIEGELTIFIQEDGTLGCIFNKEEIECAAPSWEESFEIIITKLRDVRR